MNKIQITGAGCCAARVRRKIAPFFVSYIDDGVPKVKYVRSTFEIQQVKKRLNE